MKTAAAIQQATSPTPAEYLARLLDREGGYRKVTTDSGGTTRGGIAESSGAFTADQIRNLDQKTIDDFWSKKLEATAAVAHPGVREILFDMEANLGPRAWRFARQQANTLLPPAQRLRDTSAVPDATAFARINGLEQDVYAAKLMDAFKGHHQKLVSSNPAKYKAYGSGWANRREKLWNSPAVSTLHRVPAPAPSAAPAAPPVKVSLPSKPPAGYEVVGQKPAVPKT